MPNSPDSFQHESIADDSMPDEQIASETSAANASVTKVFDFTFRNLRFTDAMSRFSDIVSDTAEPFPQKINKLLVLSSHYLRASDCIFGEFENQTLKVIAEYPVSSFLHSEFSREMPILRMLSRAQGPVDTQLVEEDCYIGCPGTRCIAAPIRIDGVIQAALLFVCDTSQSSAESEEQLLFVKMLSRYVGNEAIRKSVQAALTYRVEFEQLLNDISRSFIHVEKETIDDTIREALRRIAEFALVDSSYVMMFRDDQKTIAVSHWWMPDGKRPNLPRQSTSVGTFSWSLNRILAGEVVVMSDESRFPAEAKNEKLFMASQNMKTAILAPLLFGGRVKGVVGFASTAQRILVDENKMQLLQMVGQTLSSAVELKEAQERVQVLEDQMRHSQKLESLGVLAGGIAHDFNNLLMGVLGNAGIALQDPAVTSETRVAIERVEKIACHAGELTNQLLAYSGRGKFVVESVNISDIAANMRELLSTVVSKRHTLLTNFAQDLPVVEVDVSQLSQVVMNLITNASEAIGDQQGEITLSTGLLSVNKNSLYESYYSNNTADGVYVYMRVRDTGCGMDDETRTKIFDPFYSTKFTGRGLGLAAVLGIVRSHGGTIRVDSEVGVGTTFSVLLPCARVQEITTIPVAGIISDEERTPKKLLADKVVLVVDDEESIRTVMQSILTSVGCRCLVAANGAEALELFREHGDSIDSCLIDMTMPDMSGYELSKQLRVLRRTLPIILTSGYSEQEVRKHCASLQDTVFLQKPFHPQVLLDQLSTIF